MATGTETVAGRIEAIRPELTPVRVTVAVGLLLTAAGLLAVVQEPAVHNALHDFRHATGITCH